MSVPYAGFIWDTAPVPKQTSKPKEVMCQVGAHTPPTMADTCRVLFAMEQCGDLYPQGEVTQDIVNLAICGRDFLTEVKTYDVVLVHSVFHTSEYSLGVARSSPELKGQISPSHSAWQWGQRLCSTRARLIIICEELPFSLGGWCLGELPSYRVYKKDEKITIYVRLT